MNTIQEGEFNVMYIILVIHVLKNAINPRR